MTREEFALHYHAMKLENELFRRTGKAFQAFFEQIMQEADPSFVMVKPMGRQGDWKADGYSLNTATIYQCYAPEDMTAAKAARKIAEDFDGARSRWQDKMQRWVFVWSSERALPPQAVAALRDIEVGHPTIKILHMGRPGLWDVAKALPLAKREGLLGIVPDLAAVPMITAAEIQVLLSHLGRLGAAISDAADLDLTAIAEKLRRNGLSDDVTSLVRPALPVAKLVEKFVTGMPDPGFSQVVAAELAGRYTEFVASVGSSDAVFFSLIEYILGDRPLEPKFFWAAVGIVTYYFELCDVFDR